MCSLYIVVLVGPTRHSLIFFFLPPPTHLAARRAPRHLAARRPVVASRQPSLADPRRPRDLRAPPPAAIALAFGRPAATFARRPPPPSPSTDSRLDDGKRDARPAYWGSPCCGPAAPGRRAAAVLPPRHAGPLRRRRARPHRAGSPRSSGPAAPGCRATAELGPAVSGHRSAPAPPLPSSVSPPGRSHPTAPGRRGGPTAEGCAGVRGLAAEGSGAGVEGLGARDGGAGVDG